MSASRGIPPYDQPDETAARTAVEQWRNHPRPDGHSLTREVAGAVATARAEGRADAYRVIADRIDGALPAFGIRAGRELRALIGELRTCATLGHEVEA